MCKLFMLCMLMSSCFFTSRLWDDSDNMKSYHETIYYAEIREGQKGRVVALKGETYDYVADFTQEWQTFLQARHAQPILPVKQISAIKAKNRVEFSFRYAWEGEERVLSGVAVIQESRMPQRVDQGPGISVRVQYVDPKTPVAGKILATPFTLAGDVAVGVVAVPSVLLFLAIVSTHGWHAGP